jgi:MFS transporter, DHA1 family, multidrug resistance protein
MNSEIFKRNFLALIVSLTIPIAGLSVDIYVPSLPIISQYFGIHKSLAQLSITTYIFGFGFMQLFAGGLSDSLGRRKLFLVSIFIYILASFLAPISHTIYQLLFLRFLQGLGVGCMNVSIRAIISDLFKGQEFYKKISYITMAAAAAPIVAPVLGGYLQHYFNWYGSFYFLALYGSCMFVLSLIFVSETIKETRPFKIHKMLTNYLHMIKRWEYLGGIIILGLLYSISVLFGIIAPFLIQKVLHYSVISFSYVALLMALAWFLGTMTNRIFFEIPMIKKVKFCFCTMLLISTSMLFVSFVHSMTLYTIGIPTFLLFYLAGIIFPSYFAYTITLFPEYSAQANALMGSVMILLAGLSSGLGTLLHSQNLIPLSSAYVCISVIVLLIYYFCPRPIE